MEKIIKFVTPTNPEETVQFYKDLEHYLDPMGTGEWDQLKTLVIISIPDWGKDCTKVKGVTAQDHVDLRRKCNSAIGSSIIYLKTKHNTVILKTNFQRLDINHSNIHLSFRDQKRYNEIIFSVARSFLCDLCSWNPTQSNIQIERNICKAGVYGNIPVEQSKKLKIKQI